MSTTYAQLLALAQAAGLQAVDKARFTQLGRYGTKGPRLYVAKPFRKGQLEPSLPSPQVDVAGCVLPGQLELKAPNGSVTGHLDPQAPEAFVEALKELVKLEPAPKAPRAERKRAAPAPQTEAELAAHAELLAKVAAEMGTTVSTNA